MTLDDAKKVADVVSHADGGCPVCVQNLLDRLNETFPQFVWEYDEDEEACEVRVRRG